MSNCILYFGLNCGVDLGPVGADLGGPGLTCGVNIIAMGAAGRILIIQFLDPYLKIKDAGLI